MNARIHIGLLLAAALGVRLTLLPAEGFFCDVPDQLRAIAQGTFTIQFPGYVPYHLLVAQVATLTGDAWAALWLLSLLCGLGALVYVVHTARTLAGPGAACASGGVMALALWPVFFSVAGASYVTDMLAVSGMLYHGVQALRESRAAGRQFSLALLWLCFGVLMRPLSAMWSVPALLLLAWWARSVPRFVLAVVATGLTGLLYLLLSLPFYEGLAGFLAGTRQLSTELEAFTPARLATNIFRAIMYPIYGLHIWLLFAVVCVFRRRRARADRVFVFGTVLVAPYALLLLRYIPHAGYLCLLLPVLAVLPWLAGAEAPRWSAPRARVAAGVFAAICLAQLFVARPVETRGLGTAIANAYFLQYSRAGLKQARFETLASEMYDAGEAQREQVPAARQADIRRARER